MDIQSSNRFVKRCWGSSSAALLYGCAFGYLKTVGWLMFASFVLLFYVFFRFSVTFWHGFLWGSIACCVHLIPLAIALARYAPWYMVISGIMLLALYMAFWAGIWFWLVGRTSPVIVHVVSVFLYIWFMHTGFLWVFDYWEGYCCLHPLVPLIQYRLVADCVRWGGIGLTTAFFIGVCAFIAWLWSRCYYLMGILSSGMILFVGFVYERYMPQYVVRPACVDAVVWARVPFVPDADDMWEQAYAICMALRSTQRVKPLAQVVVMPESTFPFSLNCYPVVVSCLQNNLRGRHLIFGSHARRAGVLYNALYGLSTDGICAEYYKQHRLFFGERIPCWARVLFGMDCLLGIEEFAQAPASDAGMISLYEGYEVQPCICSDFFFGDVEKQGSAPLLILVNDGWYEGTIVPELLYQAARLKLCAAGRDGWYVAHTRGYYIDAHGRCWSLV